ncbi:MAG: FkbM family methyltransferase [Chloroflexi bacterium]|nr:FkbM family methyltransferase [Chloroflexota bacterium]
MATTVRLKQLAQQIIKALPAKHPLLALAAGLPPVLRSAALTRVWAYLAATLPQTMPLRTNLGFSRRHYRFTSDQARAVFGKPELYAGERGALELAKALARHSQGFVDIGAHLGFFAFYVREYLDDRCPVYLFEPDPDLFKLITDNVMYAALPNVIAVRQAVGHVDGTLTFYKNPEHPDMGSITTVFAEQYQTTPITVEAVRFDTFVHAHQLRQMCVKVDVENAEFEFVEGASGALDAIDSLIMEVLGPAQQKRFVQRMIREYGFHAYYINDYQVEYAPDGQFTYVHPQYNWLFCKAAPAALRVKLTGSKLKVIEPLA